MQSKKNYVTILSSLIKGEHVVMKVQELRDKIKEMDRETLEIAFVQVYKQFSKAAKEQNIDPIILDVMEHKGKVTNKESSRKQDFSELSKEIDAFLQNAKAGYYYIPNKIIPKNQRSKWRFLVKGFIKQIDQITSEDAHFQEASDYLKKIFHLLSYACGYYLFSTDDPFRSVGIPQADFYEKVLARQFTAGYTREGIDEMTRMATEVFLDRSNLHSIMSASLIYSLKTTDMKEMLMDIIKEIISEKEQKLSEMKNNKTAVYYLKENINELSKMYLGVNLIQMEEQEGFSYFMKHSDYMNREIALFVALDMTVIFGETDQWIWIYEKGVKMGIKPRESVKEIYQSHKEKQ